jgi:hypothetical protein
MTINFFSPLSFIDVFGSGIRDPGSGMGKTKDPGSGINKIKHPGSATLAKGMTWKPVVKTSDADPDQHIEISLNQWIRI